MDERGRLKEMPSWPKVEAAKAAIQRHRGSGGDRMALAAAQKALGDAFEACRAELRADITKPDAVGASEDTPTKVEKPPSASKKRTGGKKTTSSRLKSSRRSRSKD